MIRKFGIIFVISFVLCSCATPGAQRIQDLNHPLKVLQKVAMLSLPAGRHGISANAREFTSNHFVPSSGEVKFWDKPTDKDKTRYYVIITILGDRRPYTVEILAMKEKYQKGWNETRPKFEEVGYSTKVANYISDYFKDNLTKALKDRNIIDDFRVF